METRDARVGTRGTNGKTTTTTTTTRRPMSERTVVEGAGRRLVVVAAVAVVLAGVCAALARIGTRFAGGWATR
ncbi:unnamed product [Ostreococcus tauri]|uniref:Unnamed product n=1 Tax=Ostreococcus tauri TaxID=70448 RepID=A0A090N452_OSTTA|nr:unnamed product [Ostreococcus tauri]CEF99263.1 unnamed product [Ostreococcus tauri]|eukprot:XP_022839734.1 unnamed product [Ostreococcus tauri]